MIVDTSALVAIYSREDGAEDLAKALLEGTPKLPAPALVEFLRVTAKVGVGATEPALRMIRELIENGMEILAFSEVHASHAANAMHAHGKGLQQGGKLNLLDLMVYGVAKERGEPLLCTGKDYAATDLVLHPASRPW